MITALSPRTGDAEIDDLRARIAATRWPGDAGDDWSRGTRPAALRDLLRAWDGFDWPAVEQRYRDESHLIVGDDDRGVHVWRAGTPGAPVMVLLHGWPDSFVRFRGVVEALRNDYELIVPSLPGFAWSTRAEAGAGGPRWAAKRLLAALDELGVRTFFVHGGDLGTAVAEQMAVAAPERVRGIHLSDVPVWRAWNDPQLTPGEREWVDAVADWESREGAYGDLMRTKPQTLAAALTDSPAGLASWYLEKFHAWGSGDLSERISTDLILENLSLHWFTRSAASAAHVYFERRIHPPATDPVRVPAAFGLFPHDIDRGSESFARRTYDVIQFTRFERGGHFGAMEHPDLLAGDLHEFASAALSRENPSMG